MALAWSGKSGFIMKDYDSLRYFPSSELASQPIHYLWFVSSFGNILAHLSLPSWLLLFFLCLSPWDCLLHHLRMCSLSHTRPFADTINTPFILSWITNKNVKWVRTWHLSIAIGSLLTFFITTIGRPFKVEIKSLKESKLDPFKLDIQHLKWSTHSLTVIVCYIHPPDTNCTQGRRSEILWTCSVNTWNL